jgi:hypothetical protein
MKVTVNIDCTAEEARTFFGLPDVVPMQEVILKEVQEQIMKNMAAMDVETLMRVWLPKSIEGFDQIQRAFWSGMSDAMRGDRRS